MALKYRYQLSIARSGIGGTTGITLVVKMALKHPLFPVSDINVVGWF